MTNALPMTATIATRDSNIVYGILSSLTPWGHVGDDGVMPPMTVVNSVALISVNDDINSEILFSFPINR